MLSICDVIVSQKGSNVEYSHFIHYTMEVIMILGENK